MSDWTPAALAAEAERRADTESYGMCADSGLSIAECWASDLCDCAMTPPDPCPWCRRAVWDLDDHLTRRHPALRADNE